ncbi:MAG: hypothetical protein ACJ797_22345 [Ktedonobacteraceae bacterium]
MSEQRKPGQYREDRRTGYIEADHQALAVHAIHSGLDEEPKERVGHPGGRRGQAQVQRRAAELEDQQRQRRRGECVAHLGNRLARPEDPEITRSSRGHGLRILCRHSFFPFHLSWRPK